MPEQLEPEPELLGVRHVVGGEVLDPLVGDVVEVHPGAERQPGEDRHLRRGVAAGRRPRSGRPRRTRVPGPPSARPRRRRRWRPSAVRMKFVVPLTIPRTRSTWAPASDSESTRMTGTTPATAASKRSSVAALARGLPQLGAVAAQQLLVGGHDRRAAASARRRRSRAWGPRRP